MNYSEILSELEKADTFSVYRLYAALGNCLDEPARLIKIRAALHLGMQIQYFDANSNKLYDAIIEQINPKRVLVRNIHDDGRWKIPLFAINLEGSDIAITQPEKPGLTRNELQSGDLVGFIDGAGQQQAARIIRCNPKTVSVQNENGGWRVPYKMLHKIIEQNAETAEGHQVLLASEYLECE